MDRTGAPAIAADPDGNAVVVWDQTDGTRYDLWSNRHAPDEGWSTPQRIERDDAGDTFRPQVAMDPNGNAVAVWQQFDGTRDNIWANRFTPRRGWGGAERIEANNNAGGARNPQVALDSSGNAIAVWQQSDGMRDNIWANRFTPRRGWGGAKRIEVDNAGKAVAPHIAADPDGNAMAVWQQSDGTRDNIWANHYAPAEGWGAAKRVETRDAGNAEHPRVAMDAQGNAVRNRSKTTMPERPATPVWSWTPRATPSWAGTSTTENGTGSGPTGTHRAAGGAPLNPSMATPTV